MSERRSREGLGKDNGRTNVDMLLEKRERDWTELIFAKISGLATVSRDRADHIYWRLRQNNNSERASRFFCTFLYRPCITTMRNDEIFS